MTLSNFRSLQGVVQCQGPSHRGAWLALERQDSGLAAVSMASELQVPGESGPELLLLISGA